MRITIENTEKIVHLDGVPARIWEGQTDTGVPVVCYVTRISPQSNDPQDLSRFNSELMETRKPKPEVAAMPARMVL